MNPTERVLLSLGSNVGDSLENLVQAVCLLEKKGIRICKVSGIYVTEPIGYVEQDDFLNMAVQGETALGPQALLERCQEIEYALGRVRKIHGGPRTIDIDILLFGQTRIREDRLIIPHPKMGERAFVLVPLREIAPEIFERLQFSVPPQRVCLKYSRADVTMKLQSCGLSFRC